MTTITDPKVKTNITYRTVLFQAIVGLEKLNEYGPAEIVLIVACPEANNQ